MVLLEKPRVTKWESELWNIVSSGDGQHCPLYDRCRARKEGGWCVAEYIVEYDKLYNENQFTLDRLQFIKPRNEMIGKLDELTMKLAHKYLQMGNVHYPPVPGVLIALFDSRNTIEIHEVSLKALHGAIWRLKDRWVIHINSNDTSAMKRFTLFHEAFHILAHCKSNTVFANRYNETGYFNELLANYFVACLLMPMEWVREKWPEVKNLDRMAGIFDVPKMAMGIRLRRLGLI